MKLYYIWDAYCGWSYAFNHLLKAFLAQHPDLSLKMVSGGLFVDQYAKPIGQLDYLPEVNQAIQDRYGLSFGQAYQELLADGSLLLDSAAPATAFAHLKTRVGQHAHLDLALAIQDAFFQEGKSLSCLDTYLGLARRFGVAKQVLRTELTTELASRQLAKEEFTVADLFGVTSYPTLILEVGDYYAVLNQDVHTLADLEARFEVCLAQAAEETR